MYFDNNIISIVCDYCLNKINSNKTKNQNLNKEIFLFTLKNFCLTI